VVDLPRLHLFEHNDSSFVPVALRETVIEALGRTLSWGRILRGLAAPFARFLDETQATEVLDLCSGVGTPAVILATEMLRTGKKPPRFLLTDLQPHPEAWERLKRERPECIDYVREPLDATRIPNDVGRGRARVIINALHHFRPAIAAEILRGACEGGPGIFIAEGFERSPLRFAPFAVAGIPALMINPLLAPRRKLTKAWLTWATPIALAASTWDGVISTLRVYTERELREMVSPLGDAFEWDYGTYDFHPFGRGYYFKGVRQ
jgi:hypothetical protein